MCIFMNYAIMFFYYHSVFRSNVNNEMCFVVILDYRA